MSKTTTISPGDVAKNHMGDGLVLVPADVLNAWQEQLQSAFDHGLKAAGGTMVPDGARDSVELSLTLEQIEILAALADNVVEDPADRNYDSAPCLRDFLETISIHRRKK